MVLARQAGARESILLLLREEDSFNCEVDDNGKPETLEKDAL